MPRICRLSRHFGPARSARLLGAALLLLAGCARQSLVESGNRTGVFHYANTAEPANLDPHSNIRGDTDTILDALFEGLVTLAGDGQTVGPGAAERWEVSPEGLTDTFQLRANARWSDGNAVFAEVGGQLEEAQIALTGLAFLDGREPVEGVAEDRPWK